MEYACKLITRELIEEYIDSLILEFPDRAKQAKEKRSLANWFVGQVMKMTGGKPNPNSVLLIVEEKLNELQLLDSPAEHS